MILPFAKLGALLVRTLSKPLANAVKARAKNHPNFRNTIMNFAQGYHRFNVTVQRRLYGMEVDDYVKPLNEQKAVETAADLVGELVIFGVGTVVVVAEVSRSAISESRKEEARRRQLEELKQQNEAQHAELVALSQRVESLEQAAKPRGIFTGLLGSSGGGGAQSRHPPPPPPPAASPATANGGPPGGNQPPAGPELGEHASSGFEPRREGGTAGESGGPLDAGAEDFGSKGKGGGWFGFAPLGSVPHGKQPAASGGGPAASPDGATKIDGVPTAISGDQWEGDGGSRHPEAPPQQPGRAPAQ